MKDKIILVVVFVTLCLMVAFFIVVIRNMGVG